PRWGQRPRGEAPAEGAPAEDDDRASAPLLARVWATLVELLPAARQVEAHAHFQQFFALLLEVLLLGPEVLDWALRAGGLDELVEFALQEDSEDSCPALDAALERAREWYEPSGLWGAPREGPPSGPAARELVLGTDGAPGGGGGAGPAEAASPDPSFEQQLFGEPGTAVELGPLWGALVALLGRDPARVGTRADALLVRLVRIGGATPAAGLQAGRLLQLLCAGDLVRSRAATCLVCERVDESESRAMRSALRMGTALVELSDGLCQQRTVYLLRSLLEWPTCSSIVDFTSVISFQILSIFAVLASLQLSEGLIIQNPVCSYSRGEKCSVMPEGDVQSWLVRPRSQSFAQAQGRRPKVARAAGGSSGRGRGRGHGGSDGGRDQSAGGSARGKGAHARTSDTIHGGGAPQQPAGQVSDIGLPRVHPEAQEKPEEDIGAPSFHCFYAILHVLENWSFADTPERRMRCSGVLKRLRIMLEKGAPAEALDLVFELLCLPTFDKPGKDAKNRLTYHLAGRTLLPDDVQLENQLLEALQSAERHPIKQTTPNEIPTAMLTYKREHHHDLEVFF
ncbi:unnamed protein product, partial [Prorocentrum cordatum]